MPLWTLLILLILSLASPLTPTHATENKKVFSVCEDYFENPDDKKSVICFVYMEAINVWRTYNVAYILYLKNEGYKSKAETLSETDPFGCDTGEISETDFISYYIDYMNAHDERMADLFAFTIGDALEPFCKEQNRSKEPSFYLEEDKHMRKS